MANEINTTDQWTGEIISYKPLSVNVGDNISMWVSWCAQKTGLPGFKTWIVAKIGERESKSSIVDAFGNYTKIDEGNTLGLINNLGAMPNNKITGTLELWTSHVFGLNSHVQARTCFVINPAGSATPTTQADIDEQNAQAEQETGLPATTLSTGDTNLDEMINSVITSVGGSSTSGLTNGLKYAFYLIVALIAAYLIYTVVKYVK